MHNYPNFNYFAFIVSFKSTCANQLQKLLCAHKFNLGVSCAQKNWPHSTWNCELVGSTPR